MEQGSASNSGQRLEVIVAGDEGSVRLDRVLAVRLPQLSRSRLKALILAGSVTLKNAPIRDPAYHVAAGDTITIDVPEAVAAEPAGEDIALDIVHEDDDIIVINKPKGLVVHPAAGHETGTLVNALIAHCGASLSGIGGVKRPGIVHRLDKDTTGLMVAAKNDRAHKSLTEQFADHGRTNEMRRGYHGVRLGRAEPPARHRRCADRPASLTPGRRWRCATAAARPSPTGKSGNPSTAATANRSRRCWPASSRPAAPTRSGCISPISATPCWAMPSMARTSRPRPATSGPRSQAALTALGRQALHAYLLALEHPQTGEILHWESALPEDLLLLENALRAAL